MAAAIPFYKSPQTLGLITTFIAAAVALFPKAGAALGLTSSTAISTAVSNVAGLIAMIAPVVGTVVRAKQTSGQPITLTQTAADNHPATLAAEAAAIAPMSAPFNPNITAPVPIKPLTPVAGHPWGT
jgi:hypothetical protein